MQRFEISEFRAVIAGKSVVFNAFCENSPQDTADPLDRTPVVYTFYYRKHRPNNFPPFYTAWISSSVASSITNISSERHIEIVRASLAEIDREPLGEAFTIGSDELRVTQAPLEVMEVRSRLLSIAYHTSLTEPRYNMIPEDFALLLNASEDEIETWSKSLVDEKLFVSERTRRTKRFSNGTRVGDGYRLNPTKRDEVAKEIGKYSALKGEGTPLVFLSYKVVDKHLAGEFKETLEEFGFEVFLAHESIEPSQEWPMEIKKNLRACDVLLALITPAFRDSEWTDQEVGWCLGRGIPVVPVITDDSFLPHGLMSSLQGVHHNGTDVKKTCKKILKGILTQESLPDHLREVANNSLDTTLS